MSGREAPTGSEDARWPGRRRRLFEADSELEVNGWSDPPEWLTDVTPPATSGVPAYDLGPGTESVVVDLTGPLPRMAEPTEPAATAAPSAAPAPAATSQLAAWAPEPVPAPGVGPAEPVLTSYGDARPGRRRHAAPESADEPVDEPVDEPGVEPPTRLDTMGHQPELPAPAPPVQPTPPAWSVAGDAPVSPAFDIPPVPQGTGRNQAENLTAATVLRSRKARPQSGWRRVVLHLTGGRLNLGPSPADRRRADLVTRARTPVAGCHRVAVISLKGGVGKTTTTAALGAMFANLRGDRVIAIDANPDRGTLIERVPRQSGATVRHLLQSRAQLTRYGDVRAFTSQSPTRLEVLASDSDPGASDALSEQDYRDAVDTLERFYNLILTDCGTGLLHDAMRGVLGLASSLVVVSSASLDGARSASATLDWLEAHGMQALAKDAVVVISSVRPGGGIVDVMQLEDHFAARARAVVTIPYDPHLEAGGVLDLDELAEDTLDAYRELAAAVGEGFAGPA